MEMRPVLILSRLVDEEVILTVPASDSTTEITVCLTSLRGKQAHIGFDAPRKVQIDRSEVLSRRNADGDDD